jgi:hypothetical protein
MTITTEEAERLATMLVPLSDVATALRSLAAERDALQARVAELEAALRGIIDYVENTGRDYCEWYHDTKEMARAAVEGKKDE